jgi:hypothetical protein
MIQNTAETGTRYIDMNSIKGPPSQREVTLITSLWKPRDGINSLSFGYVINCGSNEISQVSFSKYSEINLKGNKFDVQVTDTTPQVVQPKTIASRLVKEACTENLIATTPNLSQAPQPIKAPPPTQATIATPTQAPTQVEKNVSVNRDKIYLQGDWKLLREDTEEFVYLKIGSKTGQIVSYEILRSLKKPIEMKFEKPHYFTQSNKTNGTMNCEKKLMQDTFIIIYNGPGGGGKIESQSSLTLSPYSLNRLGDLIYPLTCK